jgi:hydrogenase maturation protease
MRTRVIGLGNTIRTDDGVGVYAARAVAARLGGRRDVEVVEAETGGFALMELMTGWDRVILVDSVELDGLAPGEVVRMTPADLRPSLRLHSVHEIDLATALELGRRLGHPMPDEVVIFGVRAKDAWTFGEGLTAELGAALPGVVERVVGEIGRGDS